MNAPAPLPLRLWRIYAVDTRPPPPPRERLACLHIVPLASGPGIFSVKHSQLALFSRDVRSRRTPDEVFLDGVFPDIERLPYADPGADVWNRMTPADSLEADVREVGDCVLTLRYQNGAHTLSVNYGMPRAELLKMAALIKAWLAPEADY